MNEVVGMYLAVIDLAPLNPLTISVVRTLLQLSLQSWAELRRALGKKLSLTFKTIFPKSLDWPLFSIEIADGRTALQASLVLGDPPKHENPT